MAQGKPGLPSHFTWRKNQFAISEVLDEWKESGPCRNGSNESYLRKHWFRIRNNEGMEMKLYFERQPRSKSRRWQLYSIQRTEKASS